MGTSKSTGIAAALLLVVVLAAIWMLQDDVSMSVVEELETRTSRALGTRVDVNGAETDWNGGRVSLSGVTVANPGGFSEGDMIVADAVDIRGTLTERAVKEIAFRGVAANIEFRGSNSNFETLSNRIEDPPEPQNTPAEQEQGRKQADAAGDGDKDAESGGSEDEWTVDRVTFGPIKVTVSADWTSKTVSLETAPLSVEGLDGDGERLARAATIEFLAGVLKEAAARADNERLRELLLDKAQEVQARMPETD